VLASVTKGDVMSSVRIPKRHFCHHCKTWVELDLYDKEARCTCGKPVLEQWVVQARMSGALEVEEESFRRKRNKDTYTGRLFS